MSLLMFFFLLLERNVVHYVVGGELCKHYMWFLPGGQAVVRCRELSRMASSVKPLVGRGFIAGQSRKAACFFG